MNQETGIRAMMRAVGSMVFGGLMCIGCIRIPDQTQFADLEVHREEAEAFARIYARPVMGIEAIATHPWVVVKRADATEFDRWELLQFPNAAGPLEDYAHVHYNYYPKLDTTNGSMDAFAVAELTGEDAAAVVDFIELNAPNYPCRNVYLAFPGPNSNTFIQWILDETGWEVELPPSFIGQRFPVICGGEDGAKAAIHIIQSRPSRAAATVMLTPLEKEAPAYEFTLDPTINDENFALCCFPEGAYTVEVWDEHGGLATGEAFLEDGMTSVEL